MPRMTPWGKSESQMRITKGIIFHSTKKHGGVGVAKVMAEKRIPKVALDKGIFYNNYYFFEEDHAWAIPFWFMPETIDKLTEAAEKYNPGTRPILNYEEIIPKLMGTWYSSILECTEKPERKALKTLKKEEPNCVLSLGLEEN